MTVFKRLLFKFMLSVIACCTLSTYSAAQVTWDGCVDALGTPVASVHDNSINDVAMSSMANGTPIIRYNTIVLAGMHPQTRLFFYGHECGHHALGHILGRYPMAHEQEADCYGIVTLTAAGLLGDDDIAPIQSDLSRAPGNWDHLPGPYRAINLRACLQSFHAVQVTVACRHPMHQADQIPCQHWIQTPYGPRQQHQSDLVPCQHAAHPGGHEVLTIAPN